MRLELSRPSNGLSWDKTFSLPCPQPVPCIENFSLLRLPLFPLFLKNGFNQRSTKMQKQRKSQARQNNQNLAIEQNQDLPLHFLPFEWSHLHIWGWYFSQQLRTMALPSSSGICKGTSSTLWMCSSVLNRALQCLQQLCHVLTRWQKHFSLIGTNKSVPLVFKYFLRKQNNF